LPKDAPMLSLIATWTLQPGHEKAGLAALKRLAKKVLAEEPGTLVYLVHSPDPAMDSLPRVAPQQVVFFEVYADKKAFLAHVTGPLYQGFVARHKDLFLCTTVTGASGETVTTPFVNVQFLKRQAGFLRNP